MKCPNCGKKMDVVDRGSEIEYSCKCGAKFTVKAYGGDKLGEKINRLWKRKQRQNG